MTAMDAESTSATAVLGGGCFWCLDAVFRELEGVHSVESGYAGGRRPNPTYEDVCGGDTGHAEVVRVTFDPAVLGFRDLLRVFFTIHDPTTPNRQGNDVGPQYRSAIFTHSDTQRQAAERMVKEITAARIWNDKLVTEIAPLHTFWPAETEHDDYYNRNPFSGYCRAVVAPKVQKFR